MADITYTYTNREGEESLSIFLPDGVLTVNGDHPNFAALHDQAEQGMEDYDGQCREMADLAAAAGAKFDSLSERVKVSDGRIYFDGEEINSSITKLILRCLEDSTVGDWQPLVNFMEKVATNPQEHSRQQLYDWLDAQDFTIAADGDLIGYKGVDTLSDGGYVSINHGPAIVDGEAVNGAVPNEIGSVVEMARGDVQHDSHVGCSVGLHVGTYKYAKGFSRGDVLKVKVNPRDVVSVPTDCAAAKMRVCRYEVIDVITEQVAAPVDDEPAEDSLWARVKRAATDF